MREKVTAWWRGWRERSRQHAIDRALYKSGGGRGARDGGAPGTPGSSPQQGAERGGVDSGGGI